jgi:hypothetical protein
MDTVGVDMWMCEGVDGSSSESCPMPHIDNGNVEPTSSTTTVKLFLIKPIIYISIFIQSRKSSLRVSNKKLQSHTFKQQS